MQGSKGGSGRGYDAELTTTTLQRPAPLATASARQTDPVAGVPNFLVRGSRRGRRELPLGRLQDPVRHAEAPGLHGLRQRDGGRL